jgi:murein DD-endopeptidase MepM/ murein hydrolase activator NlpD
MGRREQSASLKTITSIRRLMIALTATIGFCSTSDANAFPSTQISLVYPVMGPRMSSDFGLRNHPIRKHRAHHHGVDLAAPQGAPIRVIAAGQVVYADPLGGYGKVVVVKHASGLTSHYGHCQSIGVSIGQIVKPGDILGTVGSTGLSTGPHLHFEIRQDGKPQNPERYLPGLAAPAAG